jgi:hypothetical protein
MVVYFVSAVTISFYLWLSVLAFRRWKRGKAIRRFAFLLLFSALWLLDAVLEAALPKVGMDAGHQTLIVVKINFILAALVAYYLAGFAFHFPKENKRSSVVMELLFILPIVLSVALSLFGISSAQYQNGTTQYAFPLYYLYISILFVYFIILGLVSFLRKMQRADGIQKLQLRYITVSYGVSIAFLLGMSVANAITVIDNIVNLWIANATLIFITGSAYAVLKYRLFGLRFLIRKGVVVTSTLLVLLFLYTYFIFWLRGIYSGILLTENAATLLAVIIIVLSYPVLHRIVRRIITTVFSPSEVARREKIVSKISQFTQNMNYPELLRDIEQMIKQRLGVQSVLAFVLVSPEGYSAKYPEGSEKIVIPRTHPLLQLLKEGERLLVCGEIPFLVEESLPEEKSNLMEAESLMRKLSIEVITLVGSVEVAPVLIALPEKRNRVAYTSEELDYIKDVALEMSPMFENLFLYQQALKRAGVKV